jgi:hypothetical protein
MKAVRPAFVLLFAFAALMPASAQTNGVSFAPAIMRPTGLFASSIAAGDLNHGGLADLGFLFQDGGMCVTLHALPAGGAGTSGQWTCNQPGGNTFLMFADVNLDGNLDAISTDQSPGVVVALGNGLGQFTPDGELSINCGYATEGVAVADLNGDGVPDIVATAISEGAGCLAIFLGQGGGEFAPAVEITSGGVQPLSVAVGDLNHDGIPDLVVANYGQPQLGIWGTLAVFLGKGDGTFQNPIVYSVAGYYLNRVILGDFGGNGNLDVAVIAEGVSAVIVLRGNGDGTLSDPRAFPAGAFPISLVAADLNGDGILDLAVANYTNPKPCHVSVLLGNGDGTFQPPIQYRVGVSPYQVVVGDFNGDGKPDLATVNIGDGTISILLNTTTPWPGAPQKK